MQVLKSYPLGNQPPYYHLGIQHIFARKSVAFDFVISLAS